MWLRYRAKLLARRWALRRATEAPLHEFLAASLPAPHTPLEQCELVALDLETTGLNPTRDAILSIGLVPITHMGIRLSGAWYSVLRAESPLPAGSVVIHGITDQAAAQGALLEHVLPQVLELLKGRVLVAHGAGTEIGFLNAACRRVYGGPFITPAIDTQRLAERLLRRRQAALPSGALRLFNLRARYNLPRYAAHNALSDALAAAELFLALAADIAPSGNEALGHFVT